MKRLITVDEPKGVCKIRCNWLSIVSTLLARISSLEFTLILYLYITSRPILLVEKIISTYKSGKLSMANGMGIKSAGHYSATACLIIAPAMQSIIKE